MVDSLDTRGIETYIVNLWYQPSCIRLCSRLVYRDSSRNVSRDSSRIRNRLEILLAKKNHLPRPSRSSTEESNDIVRWCTSSRGTDEPRADDKIEITVTCHDSFPSLGRVNLECRRIASEPWKFVDWSAYTDSLSVSLQSRQIQDIYR